MLLDIHTHHPYPQPEALISLRLQPSTEEIPAIEGDQLYSIGIHPWDLEKEYSSDIWERLEEIGSMPNIRAIGECGIDTKIAVPMFKQLNVFRRHVEISERLGKPLIIHDVKADDIICGLRRDLKPTQPWAIHGYRGKPGGAAQLLKAGCYLSFGKEYNPETLRSVPADRLLAETDEADPDIREIIKRLSDTRNEDLTDTIKANSEIFCNFEN